MHRIIAALVPFALTASPAAANFGQWCIDAYRADNADLGKRMAARVQQMGTAQSRADATAAIECLRIATGEDYLWHEATKRIIRADGSDPDSAGLVAEARADRARHVAQIEAEKAEADAEAAKLTAAEEEERAQEARREDLRARVRREEIVRHATVAHRLGEACNTLYRSDPDKTITNQLCYTHFLDAGLPE